MKINYRDAYESSRIFIEMLKKKNEHLNLQLDQALKDYDELQEENERLNNIINELEIFLNKVAGTSTGETITCNNILKYLQELKENKQ